MKPPGSPKLPHPHPHPIPVPVPVPVPNSHSHPHPHPHPLTIHARTPHLSPNRSQHRTPSHSPQGQHYSQSARNSPHGHNQKYSYQSSTNSNHQHHTNMLKEYLNNVVNSHTPRDRPSNYKFNHEISAEEKRMCDEANLYYVQSLHAKLDQQNKNMQALMQKVQVLSYQLKECQLERDQWRDKYNMLKLQLWTMDDILTWIINLDNGRFMKYKDILCLNFNKLQFKGSMLSTLTIHDLFKLGINDINDQQLLYNHIYNLINN